MTPLAARRSRRRRRSTRRTRPGHGEITWLEPYPQSRLAELDDPVAAGVRRETVELAFIVALQRLPPRQTATLVLRDVLAFDNGEVAAMLGTSDDGRQGDAAARQGRRSAARGGPSPDHSPAVVPPAERERAQRFAQALTAGDLERLLGLLTDEAWLAMPPAPHEYHGGTAIAGFLRARGQWVASRHVRLEYTEVNAQPAFRSYLMTDPSATAEYTGVVALTFSGSRIGAITHFLSVTPTAGGCDDMNRPPPLWDDLWSTDRHRQNAAYQAVMEETGTAVGWASARVERHRRPPR